MQLQRSPLAIAVDQPTDPQKPSSGNQKKKKKTITQIKQKQETKQTH